MSVLPSYYSQESQRLYYRALTEGDKLAWQSFFVGNDRLHFFNIAQDCDPVEQAEIWINRQLQRYKDDNYGMLAVAEKESDRLVGQCGLIQRNFDQGPELEIGYSFLQEFWGKGYATEAALQMKKFAKEHKIVPRVVSMIDPENYPSIKVAEKNGMSPAFNTIFETRPHVVYATKNFEEIRENY